MARSARTSGATIRPRRAVLSALSIFLCAVVLAPACWDSAGATSQQPPTAVALHQLVTAAQRSLRSNLELYSQSQVGEVEGWFTQLVVLNGQNVAVYRLSPTSRVASSDSVLRLAHRAPDGMSIGCAWYERQPDGSYWEEPDNPSTLVGPLEDVRLIAHITRGQLNGPVDVSSTGGGQRFSLSFRYAIGHYVPFDSVLAVTTEHGVLRQITLVMSDGLLAATTHILLGHAGQTIVSAPLPRQVSRIVGGTAPCVS